MQQTNTIENFKLLIDNALLPYNIRVYNAQSTDFNYTLSDMDVLPDIISAQTLSTRIGTSVEAFKAIGKGTIWIGAMYLDINEKVSDKINLLEKDPEIADILGDEIGYEMTMGVKEPVNFLFGGSWLSNARMNLWLKQVLETGVRYCLDLISGFN